MFKSLNRLFSKQQQTKLIFLALTLLMNACSSNEDTKSKKPNNPPRDESEAKVISDLSLCDKGPLASDPRGLWEQDLESQNKAGKMNFHMQFRFDGQNFGIRNTCNIAGRQLTAEVNSAAKYDSKQIHILESKADQDSFDNGDIKMNCRINLQKASFNYKFRGSCLVLSAPNQEDMVLLPVEHSVQSTNDQLISSTTTSDDSLKSIPTQNLSANNTVFQFLSLDYRFACRSKYVPAAIGKAWTRVEARAQAGTICAQSRGSAYCVAEADFDCEEVPDAYPRYPLNYRFACISNYVPGAAGRGLTKIEAISEAAKLCSKTRGSAYCTDDRDFTCEAVKQ